MPSIETWRWFVLEVLDSDQGLSWEQGFDWVAEEHRYELRTAISQLQAEGLVRHNHVAGGFLLADESTVAG